MRAQVDLNSLNISEPTFRDGRPCIAGTGISVLAIVVFDSDGLTAEEIAALAEHTGDEGMTNRLGFLSNWL